MTLILETDPIKSIVCHKCLYDEKSYDVTYIRLENARPIIQKGSNNCESCPRLVPNFGKIFRKFSTSFTKQTSWSLPILADRTVVLYDSSGIVPKGLDISEDKQFVWEIRIDVDLGDPIGKVKYAAAQTIYKSYEELFADANAREEFTDYWWLKWNFPLLQETFMRVDRHSPIELKGELGAEVFVYISDGESNSDYTQLPDLSSTYGLEKTLNVLSTPYKEIGGSDSTKNVVVKCEGYSYDKNCYKYFVEV